MIPKTPRRAERVFIDMNPCGRPLLLLLCALFAGIRARAATRADEERLLEVASLLRQHNGKEANAKARAALAEYKQEGDERQQARCYLLLAFADTDLQDVRAARADLREAAARLEAVGDRFGAWFALVTLGELDRREGQLDDAVAHHEKALQLLAELRSPAAEFSIDTFRLIAPILGLSPDALGPMVQSPIVKPLVAQFGEVITRDAYAAALLDLNQTDRADAQLTRALDLARIFGGMLDASIVTHLGDLRRQQWHLDEARDLYRKALQAPAGNSVASFRDDIHILGQLADLELVAGHIDEALAWNDRALALARAATNWKREARLLEERAGMLKDDGRYDRAEETFNQALKIADGCGDIYEQASIKASVGMMNMLRGRYGTSIADLERSIELFQKIDEPYAEAPVWALLTTVYLLLDANDDAMLAFKRMGELAEVSHFALAEQFVDALKKGGGNLFAGKLPGPELGQALESVWSHPEAQGLPLTQELRGLVRTLTGLNSDLPVNADGPHLPEVVAMLTMQRGLALFRKGDMEGARQAWNQASSMQLGRELHAVVLVALAATHADDPEKRTQYLRDAVEVLETQINDIHVEELLSGFLGGYHHWYFDAVIETLLQQGRAAEAFDYAERARARAFLQLLGNHKLGSGSSGEAASTRDAETLRVQLSALERQYSTAPSAQLANDLKQGRSRYEALLKRAKVTNPEYDATLRVEPLHLTDVQKELPVDATLISYYVTPKRVHAWIVERQAVESISLPIDPAALDRIICWADQFGLRRSVRGVAPIDPRCPAEPLTSQEAFRQMFAPLQRHVHNTRLIIVPHNVLHYIPFAALRDPRSGRYLVEDYTITYVPSASVLRFLRAKESPVNGNALVLGDPDSMSGKLEGAHREAVAVAQMLHTMPRLGANATEGLLHRLEGKVDLIHIAAHGYYDAINPLFSRIALAPENEFDGNLEVHEILADIDLTGVNLVVLSACQTALGKGNNGDDVVGLTRAFLYAGAPGVISTLWNVNDDAAVALMGSFYERLLGGESAAAALRQAQIAMLRGRQYSDPAFWAPFTMTGDPQGRWSAVVH